MCSSLLVWSRLRTGSWVSSKPLQYPIKATPANPGWQPLILHVFKEALGQAITRSHGPLTRLISTLFWDVLICENYDIKSQNCIDEFFLLKHISWLIIIQWMWVLLRTSIALPCPSHLSGELAEEMGGTQRPPIRMVHVAYLWTTTSGWRSRRSHSSCKHQYRHRYWYELQLNTEETWNNKSTLYN